MTDPIPLQVEQGSFLASINFYRMPDGSIRAAIQDMPTHVIEAEDTIAARFFNAAQWCASGSLSLMQQGICFDEEHQQFLEARHD